MRRRTLLAVLGGGDLSAAGCLAANDGPGDDIGDPGEDSDEPGDTSDLPAE